MWGGSFSASRDFVFEKWIGVARAGVCVFFLFTSAKLRMGPLIKRPKSGAAFLRFACFFLRPN